MSIDHRVSEISSSRPRLRRDVRTHYQEYRGEPTYIIEDTSKGRFFHVGFPEHQFIQSFDGRTTIAQALARNAATQGEDALTEQQGEQMLRWLIDNDLLESETSGQGERRREQWTRQREKRKQNPVAKIMFFKIPLGCPDRLLTSSQKWLGWLFSLPGLLLWLFLIAYTAAQLAPEWERFVSAAGQVIAPENWIRVIAIYAVLKVLHEFGHGLATRRYGGAVPEWGVQLLAFVTPLAFVDASSSWKFTSKWKRIVVAGAGMYVEVAIACVCLLGWLNTTPGILNTSLHSAVIAATFVTVLFNANPLMRFDGYYILCDLLGIPNLGTKGQQFLVWFGKSFFLGVKDLPMPPAARQHPVAVPLYGVLAAIWKVVIWIGITIIVSLLFKGAGLVLALASILFVLGSMVVKFITFLGKKGTGVKPLQVMLRLGALVGALALLLFLVRINPTGRALGVVEYTDRENIRAGVRGKVETVLVNEGDTVKEGDILAHLSNPDEEAEYKKLEVELQWSKIRARSYYQAEDLSAYQAELETIEGLEEKILESRKYLAALEVKAPTDGRIVGRKLESLPGTWLNVGDEILSVIGSEEKELLISIRQEDFEEIAEQDDPVIRVRLRGRPKEISGKLDRLESRATRTLPHEVMAAPGGGPLALRASAEPLVEREKEIAQEKDRSQTGLMGRQLVDSRFIGRASLSLEGKESPLEGEWGYVRFANAERERLGVWLFEEVNSFVREKIQQAKAQAAG